MNAKRIPANTVHRREKPATPEAAPVQPSPVKSLRREIWLEFRRFGAAWHDDPITVGIPRGMP